MENSKKKILHVDDEADTREIVKKILEDEGFEVTGTKSAKETLGKIKTDGFGLIILDIMMSDMSGWDLFTQIAKIDPSAKVIFLSILEISKERIKQIKKRGARDYITKPFDNEDFVKRVKKAIEG